MVRVNCAAIPEGLIESELFGREKGAYTGATTRQIGRFEVRRRFHDFSRRSRRTAGRCAGQAVARAAGAADRAAGQLASDRHRRRVIAATNRDLERAVADGTFRQDLYYRLDVFPITVPPLRERPEDIPILAWSFVEEFAKALGKRIESIPKEQVARAPALRVARQCQGASQRHRARRHRLDWPAARRRAAARATRHDRRRSVRLAEVERDHIRSVLENAGWRVRGHGGAAELLGLKPSTLEGRMTKLEIRRPRH